MSIFSTTSGITRASLRVLRSRPRLMLFPVLGALATLTMLVLLLPVLDDPISGLALGLLYFLCHGIMVFFSAALVCESLRALRGQPTSIVGGLGCAGSRIAAIAVYSIIESTVGLFLGGLAKRSDSSRWLSEWIFGTAWSLVSYLALPVIVAERRGGYESLRRSGELLHRIWGETALSDLGFRVVTNDFLLAVILICLLIARRIDAPLAVVVAIALILGFAVVAGALQAIYRAALYIYVAEGAVPDDFDTSEMHAVWRVK